MAASKSKTSARSGAGRRSRVAGEAVVATTAVFVGPDQVLPEGTAGVTLKVLAMASKLFAGRPERMTALLQVYGNAIARSRADGRPVSFRVDVDPEGGTVVTPVEDAITTPEPVMDEASVPDPAPLPDPDLAPDPDLQAALAAARARGRLRAAEILSGDDMLNADAFARMLGTSRVTVNAKRRNGQILGLDGARRGFRFPVWQLDAEGRPYAELAMLHERLGGPWAVYRFLVQPHGELDGLTGREALARGNAKAVFAAVESAGRDFR